ncbi:MAG: ABC transporter permease subunit [Spirochaetales bacterium]|nr:ABC transporter permease subunit [Spirochaetales bacterium]
MRKQIILAIIRKDIKEIRSGTMLIGPVFIPQTATCLFLPALILILGYLYRDTLLGALPFLGNTLLPLYHVPPVFGANYEKILYIIANFTFVPLLMLMPLQAAMVIGINSFIGEKQRKTLETMLYTPVRNREFITAKLAAVLVPSVLLTLAECIIYAAVCNLISYLFSGKLIITSPVLFLSALVFNPAVSAFGLTIVMLVAVRARSHAEAEHIAGLFILPFISLMITQVTGLYTLSLLQIIAAALILTLISLVLLFRTAPRFRREEIIKTCRS